MSPTLGLGLIAGTVLGAFALGRASRGGPTAAAARSLPGGGRPPLDAEARRRDDELRRLRAVESNHKSFVVNFPEHVKNLTASLDPPEVLGVVVRACTDLLRASAMQVYQLDPSGEQLVLKRATENRRSLEVPSSAACRADEGLQAWLLSQATPHASVESPDAAGDIGLPQLEVGDQKFPVALAAPILLRGEPKGLINISALETNTEEQKRLLSCVANLAAISLENAVQMADAREQANRDRMTGLFNHAHFQVTIGRLLEEAESKGERVSLLLLDVDHFKRYNDTHGHQAGDAALKTVAQVLRRSVRPTDFVARYGGEEFALIFVSDDPAAIISRADLVREAVEREPLFSADGGPLASVTVSGGMASFPDDAKNPLGLIEIADRSLYRAKHGGRNRVCVHAPEAPEARETQESGRASPDGAWDSAADPGEPPSAAADPLRVKA